ncbi:MAG: Membrane-bound lytic murein transglycosylase F precursor [Syntrophorhabdus sp. PtaU1.Bin058]|nr:MAG: Membrane-bound lytic murein transglycosylase F precursor [Syntrophorhabdus sp. PtaU1.Bin058]
MKDRIPLLILTHNDIFPILLDMKGKCLLNLLLIIIVAAMIVPAIINAADETFDEKPVAEADVEPPAEEPSPILYRPVKKNFADLSPNTRTIRVLVEYSRFGFFVANGRPYGLEYEALAEYEKYLNKKRSKRAPRISVTFIPVHFENLIPYLLDGKGDIAAGQITITKERQQRVTFTSPYIHNVREVLVAYAGAPAPHGLEDLSGKTVHVIRQGSYVQHLNDLNQKLSGEKLSPIKIVETPATITGSDIIEMVNAGILEYTFVDDFMAALWSKVLPDIRVLNDICLNQVGDIAWAVRPDNPKLLESLNRFIDYAQHNLQAKANRVWKDYFKDTKFIKNPLSLEAYALVKTLSPHFKEAGAMNKLDWLMMMAQGYQESELNQNTQSPRGAIGIMQVLPSTAKSMGFKDITKARNNILAGVAYLRHIMQNYFTDREISPDARVDFALAAYNAGPARINSLRHEAKKKGFNPNIWFGNVERVALEKIGEETVRYVANINKYYIAYRMSHDLDKHKTDLSGSANLMDK